LNLKITQNTDLSKVITYKTGGEVTGFSFLCRPLKFGLDMLLNHKNIDFSNILHYFGGISLFFLAFVLAELKDVTPVFAGTPVNIAQTNPDSVSVITLGFAGDLMCHTPQMSNAKQSDGSYDFNPTFAEIKAALSAPDIMIGNLELTMAGPKKPYGGYPAFNSPDEYITAITNSGFDFVVTSNNHSMDTGEDGLQRTLQKVREAGLGSTGTFDSQRDHDSIRILVKNGISIAILNYTYGTNGAYPSAAHKYMLNVADSTSVGSEVRLARSLNPDIVVVIYHWGIENIAEPTAKQDSMFHWAADNGADLIIGAHPHVVGPIDYFKTKKNASLDSGIVAWSLGNFISNQYWRYTDAGLILNVTIEKNFATGKKSLKKTGFIPTWVYRAYDPALKQHVIVPATWCGTDSLPQWMNAESKTRMCEAFDDTKKMVSKYGANFDLQR
jgi:poly-gamma-glutamate synthesis protein (capsule biosynthesis protein)